MAFIIIGETPGIVWPTANNVTFSVRGNAQDAYYSGESSSGYWTGNSQPTSGADVGALSGGLINLTNAANQCLLYEARNNCPDGRPMSGLLRVKMPYTGAPSATSYGFFVLGPQSSTLLNLTMHHMVTTGQLRMHGRVQNTSIILNEQSFGTWTDNETGTYYDIVWTWDGTTTANAFKVYIDAELLGQATATTALPTTFMGKDWKLISLGTGSRQAISNYYLDEFVLWNTVIDPTAVVLADGTTGSLNGASRTSLVAA